MYSNSIYCMTNFFCYKINKHKYKKNDIPVGCLLGECSCLSTNEREENTSASFRVVHILNFKTKADSF